ncbi:hypothetical protein VTL71DRAFT_5920 [Oculimacula yallundae]|uniref:GATA-type domain-containing protein n=1 Tax=Oculimacula yallundae TaxID=86028 RepID=A0ABR4BYX0_9HELO
MCEVWNLALTGEESELICPVFHCIVGLTILPGLVSGDSGSLVVDAGTNEVYGHVIASNPLGEAYVVPLVATLGQIKGFFKVDDVSLPEPLPLLSRLTGFYFKTAQEHSAKDRVKAPEIGTQASALVSDNIESSSQVASQPQQSSRMSSWETGGKPVPVREITVEPVTALSREYSTSISQLLLDKKESEGRKEPGLPTHDLSTVPELNWTYEDKWDMYSGGWPYIMIRRLSSSLEREDLRYLFLFVNELRSVEFVESEDPGYKTALATFWTMAAAGYARDILQSAAKQMKALLDVDMPRVSDKDIAMLPKIPEGAEPRILPSSKYFWLGNSSEEAFNLQRGPSTEKTGHAIDSDLRYLTPILEADESESMERHDTQTACSNCFTQSTPLWRRDDDGHPLCNACGLFLKLHGVVRPLSLRTEEIKRLNRGTSSKVTTGDEITFSDHIQRARDMRRKARTLEQTPHLRGDMFSFVASDDEDELSESSSSSTPLAGAGTSMASSSMASTVPTSYYGSARSVLKGISTTPLPSS